VKVAPRQARAGSRCAYLGRTRVIVSGRHGAAARSRDALESTLLPGTLHRVLPIASWWRCRAAWEYPRHRGSLWGVRPDDDLGRKGPPIARPDPSPRGLAEPAVAHRPGGRGGAVPGRGPRRLPEVPVLRRRPLERHRFATAGSLPAFSRGPPANLPTRARRVRDRSRRQAYAWTIPIAFPVTAELGAEAGARTDRRAREQHRRRGRGPSPSATSTRGNKGEVPEEVYGTERTTIRRDMVLKGANADKTHPPRRHPPRASQAEAPRSSGKSTCLPPRAVARLLAARCWNRVVAFQTRNPSTVRTSTRSSTG